MKYVFKNHEIISTKRETSKTRQKRENEKMKDGDRYFLEVFPQYISQGREERALSRKKK